MSINISNNERPLKPGLRVGIVKRVVQVILLILLQASLLFLAAGSFLWEWAWTFVLLNVATVTLNMTILLNYHPETIIERAETEGLTLKGWDKIVGGLWGVTYFVGLLLVAGLDWRFGWTGAIGLIWHGLGSVIFILGGALFSWAMIANAYFATVACIREGQTVCSSGPYQFVRHPGHAGIIIQSMGIPLLLGSLWALLPGGLAVLLMVARTALEDSALQEEMPGYETYTRQVQHQLLPHIW